MNIYFFKKPQSIEDLKSQRNKLAIKFHPDKVIQDEEKQESSKKMARINEEYNFLKKKFDSDINFFKEKKQDQNNGTELSADQQAKIVFNAISDTRELYIKIPLLYSAFNQISDYKPFFKAYKKNYGLDTVAHLKKAIKNEKIKSILLKSFMLYQQGKSIKNEINSF